MPFFVRASKVVSSFYFFYIFIWGLANTWLTNCVQMVTFWLTNAVKWQQMAMCVRYIFVDIWT